jgi:hypothetical protein
MFSLTGVPQDKENYFWTSFIKGNLETPGVK